MHISQIWYRLAGVFLLALHIGLWVKLRIWNLASGRVAMLDFDTYMLLAREVWQGLHPYQVDHMDTQGPPLVLLPYLFLIWLPIVWARSFMIISSIGVGYWASWKLVKSWVKAQHFLWFGLVSLVYFSSFPVRLSLGLGQSNLWLAGLLTLLLTSTSHRAKSWAMSSLVIIKTYWLTVFVALLKSSRPTVFRTGIIVTAVTILCLPLLKWNYYTDFLSRPGQLLQAQQPANLDYYNQSIVGTFQRLGMINESSWPWHFVAIGLVMTVGFGLAYRQQFLVLAITTSLLISPVLWQHYLATLLPIIFWLGLRSWRTRWSWVWLVAVLFAWVEFPWIHLAEMNLPNRVLASHYFVSLVLFWGLSLVLTTSNHRTQAGMRSST